MDFTNSGRAAWTRPALLDVTLRDGGLKNQFAFSLDDCVSIAQLAARFGIGCEVGYYRPRRTQQSGPAVCDKAYLELLRERASGASLAVMVHTTEVGLDDYSMLRDAGVRLVRFPTSKTNEAELEWHVEAVRELGIPFSLNLVRVTERSVTDIAHFARMCARLDAPIVYFADSNGGLFPNQIPALAAALRDETDATLAFHAHDNLSLAFANSLASLKCGFSLLDASLGGLGKGGGNLVLELIAAHLNTSHGCQFAVFEMIELCEQTVSKWLTVEARERFMQSIFGLLNYNVDTIDRLSNSCAGRRELFEKLAHEYQRITDRPPPPQGSMKRAFSTEEAKS